MRKAITVSEEKVLSVLNTYCGRLLKAAEVLGVARTTLWRYIKAHGIVLRWVKKERTDLLATEGHEAQNVIDAAIRWRRLEFPNENPEEPSTQELSESSKALQSAIDEYLNAVRLRRSN
jgi:hypothetical protein